LPINIALIYFYFLQKLSRSHDFGSFCFGDTRWRESLSSPKAVAIASLLRQESVVGAKHRTTDSLNRQDEWLAKQGA
jgi:hypothetical protein